MLWPRPPDGRISRTPHHRRTQADVSLRRVVTDAARRAFLALPYQLYRGDGNWIPRLWPEQVAWLRRQNPFFEQGDADWFVARRDGRVVGTIGVALDHAANRVHDRRWGIFGFLEFMDDEQEFAALTNTAREDFQLRGAT